VQGGEAMLDPQLAYSPGIQAQNSNEVASQPSAIGTTSQRAATPHLTGDTPASEQQDPHFDGKTLVSKGTPKTKRVVEAAALTYKFFLATRNPFPEATGQRTIYTLEAWQQGLSDAKLVGNDAIRFTAGIEELVSCLLQIDYDCYLQCST